MIGYPAIGDHVIFFDRPTFGEPLFCRNFYNCGMHGSIRTCAAITYGLWGMFCFAGRGSARWSTGSPDKDTGPLSLPVELGASYLIAWKHPGACVVAASGIRSDPMQLCASIRPDSHAHSTRGPSNQSPHTPSPSSGFHKAPSPVPAESA